MEKPEPLPEETAPIEKPELPVVSDHDISPLDIGEKIIDLVKPTEIEQVKLQFVSDIDSVIPVPELKDLTIEKKEVAPKFQVDIDADEKKFEEMIETLPDVMKLFTDVLVDKTTPQERKEISDFTVIEEESKKVILETDNEKVEKEITPTNRDIDKLEEIEEKGKLDITSTEKDKVFPEKTEPKVEIDLIPKEEKREISETAGTEIEMNVRPVEKIIDISDKTDEKYIQLDSDIEVPEKRKDSVIAHISPNEDLEHTEQTGVDLKTGVAPADKNIKVYKETDGKTDIDIVPLDDDIDMPQKITKTVGTYIVPKGDKKLPQKSGMEIEMGIAPLDEHTETPEKLTETVDFGIIPLAEDIDIPEKMTKQVGLDIIPKEEMELPEKTGIDMEISVVPERKDIKISERTDEKVDLDILPLDEDIHINEKITKAVGIDILPEKTGIDMEICVVPERKDIKISERTDENVDLDIVPLDEDIHINEKITEVVGIDKLSEKTGIDIEIGVVRGNKDFEISEMVDEKVDLDITPLDEGIHIHEKTTETVGIDITVLPLTLEETEHFNNVELVEKPDVTNIIEEEKQKRMPKVAPKGPPKIDEIEIPLPYEEEQNVLDDTIDGEKQRERSDVEAVLPPVENALKAESAVFEGEVDAPIEEIVEVIKETIQNDKQHEQLKLLESEQLQKTLDMDEITSAFEKDVEIFIAKVDTAEIDGKANIDIIQLESGIEIPEKRKDSVIAHVSPKENSDHTERTGVDLKTGVAPADKNIKVYKETDGKIDIDIVPSDDDIDMPQKITETVGIDIVPKGDKKPPQKSGMEIEMGIAPLDKHTEIPEKLAETVDSGIIPLAEEIDIPEKMTKQVGLDIIPKEEMELPEKTGIDIEICVVPERKDIKISERTDEKVDLDIVPLDEDIHINEKITEAVGIDIISEKTGIDIEIGVVQGGKDFEISEIIDEKVDLDITPLDEDIHIHEKTTETVGIDVSVLPLTLEETEHYDTVEMVGKPDVTNIIEEEKQKRMPKVAPKGPPNVDEIEIPLPYEEEQNVFDDTIDGEKQRERSDVEAVLPPVENALKAESAVFEGEVDAPTEEIVTVIRETLYIDKQPERLKLPDSEQLQNTLEMDEITSASEKDIEKYVAKVDTAEIDGKVSIDIMQLDSDIEIPENRKDTAKTYAIQKGDIRLSEKTEIDLKVGAVPADKEISELTDGKVGLEIIQMDENIDASGGTEIISKEDTELSEKTVMNFELTDKDIKVAEKIDEINDLDIMTLYEDIEIPKKTEMTGIDLHANEVIKYPENTGIGIEIGVLPSDKDTEIPEMMDEKVDLDMITLVEDTDIPDKMTETVGINMISKADMEPFEKAGIAIEICVEPAQKDIEISERIDEKVALDIVPLDEDIHIHEKTTETVGIDIDSEKTGIDIEINVPPAGKDIEISETIDEKVDLDITPLDEDIHIHETVTETVGIELISEKTGIDIEIDIVPTEKDIEVSEKIDENVDLGIIPFEDDLHIHEKTTETIRIDKLEHTVPLEHKSHLDSVEMGGKPDTANIIKEEIQKRMPKVATKQAPDLDMNELPLPFEEEVKVFDETIDVEKHPETTEAESILQPVDVSEANSAAFEVEIPAPAEEIIETFREVLDFEKRPERLKIPEAEQLQMALDIAEITSTADKDIEKHFAKVDTAEVDGKVNKDSMLLDSDIKIPKERKDIGRADIDKILTGDIGISEKTRIEIEEETVPTDEEISEKLSEKVDIDSIPVDKAVEIDEKPKQTFERDIISKENMDVTLKTRMDIERAVAQTDKETDLSEKPNEEVDFEVKPLSGDTDIPEKSGKKGGLDLIPKEDIKLFEKTGRDVEIGVPSTNIEVELYKNIDEMAGLDVVPLNEAFDVPDEMTETVEVDLIPKRDIESPKKTVIDIDMGVVVPEDKIAEMTEKIDDNVDLHIRPFDKDLQIQTKTEESVGIDIVPNEDTELTEKTGINIEIGVVQENKDVEISEVDENVDLDIIQFGEDTDMPEKTKKVAGGDIHSKEDVEISQNAEMDLEISFVPTNKDIKISEKIDGKVDLNIVPLDEDVDTPKPNIESLGIYLIPNEDKNRPEKTGIDIDVGVLTADKDDKVYGNIGEKIDLDIIPLVEDIRSPEKMSETVGIDMIPKEDFELPEKSGIDIEICVVPAHKDLEITERIDEKVDLDIVPLDEDIHIHEKMTETVGVDITSENIGIDIEINVPSAGKDIQISEIIDEKVDLDITPLDEDIRIHETVTETVGIELIKEKTGIDIEIGIAPVEKETEVSEKIDEKVGLDIMPLDDHIHIHEKMTETVSIDKIVLPLPLAEKLPLENDEGIGMPDVDENVNLDIISLDEDSDISDKMSETAGVGILPKDMEIYQKTGKDIEIFEPADKDIKVSEKIDERVDLDIVQMDESIYIPKKRETYGIDISPKEDMELPEKVGIDIGIDVVPEHSEETEICETVDLGTKALDEDIDGTEMTETVGIDMIPKADMENIEKTGMDIEICVAGAHKDVEISERTDEKVDFDIVPLDEDIHIHEKITETEEIDIISETTGIDIEIGIVPVDKDIEISEKIDETVDLEIRPLDDYSHIHEKITVKIEQPVSLEAYELFDIVKSDGKSDLGNITEDEKQKQMPKIAQKGAPPADELEMTLPTEEDKKTYDEKISGENLPEKSEVECVFQSEENVSQSESAAFEFEIPAPAVEIVELFRETLDFQKGPESLHISEAAQLQKALEIASTAEKDIETFAAKIDAAEIDGKIDMDIMQFDSDIGIPEKRIDAIKEFEMDVAPSDQTVKIIEKIDGNVDLDIKPFDEDAYIHENFEENVDEDIYLKEEKELPEQTGINFGFGVAAADKSVEIPEKIESLSESFDLDIVPLDEVTGVPKTTTETSGIDITPKEETEPSEKAGMDFDIGVAPSDRDDKIADKMDLDIMSLGEDTDILEKNLETMGIDTISKADLDHPAKTGVDIEIGVEPAHKDTEISERIDEKVDLDIVPLDDDILINEKLTETVGMDIISENVGIDIEISVLHADKDRDIIEKIDETVDLDIVPLDDDIDIPEKITETVGIDIVPKEDLGHPEKTGIDIEISIEPALKGIEISERIEENVDIDIVPLDDSIHIHEKISERVGIELNTEKEGIDIEIGVARGDKDGEISKKIDQTSNLDIVPLVDDIDIPEKMTESVGRDIIPKEHLDRPEKTGIDIEINVEPAYKGIKMSERTDENVDLDIMPLDEDIHINEKITETIGIDIISEKSGIDIEIGIEPAHKDTEISETIDENVDLDIVSLDEDIHINEKITETVGIDIISEKSGIDIEIGIEPAHKDTEISETIDENVDLDIVSLDEDIHINEKITETVGIDIISEKSGIDIEIGVEPTHKDIEISETIDENVDLDIIPLDVHINEKITETVGIDIISEKSGIDIEICVEPTHKDIEISETIDENVDLDIIPLDEDFHINEKITEVDGIDIIPEEDIDRTEKIGIDVKINDVPANKYIEISERIDENVDFDIVPSDEDIHINEKISETVGIDTIPENMGVDIETGVIDKYRELAEKIGETVDLNIIPLVDDTGIPEKMIEKGGIGTIPKADMQHHKKIGLDIEIDVPVHKDIETSERIDEKVDLEIMPLDEDIHIHEKITEKVGIDIEIGIESAHKDTEITEKIDEKVDLDIVSLDKDTHIPEKLTEMVAIDSIPNKDIEIDVVSTDKDINLSEKIDEKVDLDVMSCLPQTDKGTDISEKVDETVDSDLLSQDEDIHVLKKADEIVDIDISSKDVKGISERTEMDMELNVMPTEKPTELSEQVDEKVYLDIIPLDEDIKIHGRTEEIIAVDISAKDKVKSEIDIKLGIVPMRSDTETLESADEKVNLDIIQLDEDIKIPKSEDNIVPGKTEIDIEVDYVPTEKETEVSEKIHIDLIPVNEDIKIPEKTEQIDLFPVDDKVASEMSEIDLGIDVIPADIDIVMSETVDKNADRFILPVTDEEILLNGTGTVEIERIPQIVETVEEDKHIQTLDIAFKETPNVCEISASIFSEEAETESVVKEPSKVENQPFISTRDGALEIVEEALKGETAIHEVEIPAPKEQQIEFTRATLRRTDKPEMHQMEMFQERLDLTTESPHIARIEVPVSLEEKEHLDNVEIGEKPVITNVIDDEKQKQITKVAEKGTPENDEIKMSLPSEEVQQAFNAAFDGEKQPHTSEAEVTLQFLESVADTDSAELEVEISAPAEEIVQIFRETIDVEKRPDEILHISEAEYFQKAVEIDEITELVAKVDTTLKKDAEEYIRRDTLISRKITTPEKQEKDVKPETEPFQETITYANEAVADEEEIDVCEGPVVDVFNIDEVIADQVTETLAEDEILVIPREEQIEIHTKGYEELLSSDSEESDVNDENIEDDTYRIQYPEGEEIEEMRTTPIPDKETALTETITIITEDKDHIDVSYSEKIELKQIPDIYDIETEVMSEYTTTKQNIDNCSEADTILKNIPVQEDFDLESSCEIIEVDIHDETTIEPRDMPEETPFEKVPLKELFKDDDQEYIIEYPQEPDLKVAVPVVVESEVEQGKGTFVGVPATEFTEKELDLSQQKLSSDEEKADLDAKTGDIPVVTKITTPDKQEKQDKPKPKLLEEEIDSFKGTRPDVFNIDEIISQHVTEMLAEDEILVIPREEQVEIHIKGYDEDIGSDSDTSDVSDESIEDDTYRIQYPEGEELEERRTTPIPERQTPLTEIITIITEDKDHIDASYTEKIEIKRTPEMTEIQIDIMPKLDIEISSKADTMPKIIPIQEGFDLESTCEIIEIDIHEEVTDVIKDVPEEKPYEKVRIIPIKERVKTGDQEYFIEYPQESDNKESDLHDVESEIEQEEGTSLPIHVKTFAKEDFGHLKPSEEKEKPKAEAVSTTTEEVSKVVREVTTLEIDLSVTPEAKPAAKTKPLKVDVGIPVKQKETSVLGVEILPKEDMKKETAVVIEPQFEENTSVVEKQEIEEKEIVSLELKIPAMEEARTEERLIGTEEFCLAKAAYEEMTDKATESMSETTAQIKYVKESTLLDEHVSADIIDTPTHLSRQEVPLFKPEEVSDEVLEILERAKEAGTK